MKASFILLFLFFSIISSSFSRDLIVLATPQTPFKYKERGVIKGIDVEVLDYVMKKLGLTYKIQLIESDSRILHEAETGRADMLLLFSKKKSRMKYLIYPKESYIDLTWHFFIRAEDKDKIKYNKLEDLKKYKIGATKSLSYTPDFWNAGFNLDLTSKNCLQINKLLAKRFDLVPLNTINTLYEEGLNGNLDKIAYLPKPLKTKKYYNVFTKKSDFPNKLEIIKEYDKIIKDMKKNGIIQDIYNKYLGHKYY